ncbi:hypothetical protein HY78_14535 [Rhizorhabdus wittichii DC-6]|nr:hypothetical protein HY78_14535 [Rhizorhabdus wittichii DC-6]
MGSIRLNTPFRRKTKAGLVYADVGETLIVGEEVSAEDAAKLLGRDPPGAEEVAEEATDSVATEPSPAAYPATVDEAPPADPAPVKGKPGK